jgi:DNA ligase-1
MRAFARLYEELDETSATGEKVAALVRYFRAAPPADAAWAVHFLIGRRPKRLVGPAKLRTWAARDAGIPDWLFEESYHAVGDLAETITLLLSDDALSSDLPLSVWVEERLLPLHGQDDVVQQAELARAWHELGRNERYVWNKLITGSFRVGASARLVIRALAELSGVDEGTIAHRLMGAWEPGATFFERLVAPDTRDADVSRPYPFYLAYPLEQAPETLGEAAEWIAEWKWDGIRAQLIRRAGRVFLWSRGEELLSGRFPEVEEAGALLPEGTVIDGELLPWAEGGPLPFAQMQRRIGRKVLGRRILSEVPVVLVAYDLLEEEGRDLRALPFERRRARLEALLRVTPAAGRLVLSPAVDAEGWEALARARASARERCAEGLMLKRRASTYGVGRRRGDWWKWKVEPHSVDAVLMYAQPGSGRRAGLYTDYTFGVWDGDRLVAFAKAYSGLTDEEIRRVDAFIRRNTLEKFGPVRTVKPELVFEIAFEGIQRSTRHKSGIAVRFPRMARWRTDKRPADADTLETVWGLIGEETGRRAEAARSEAEPGHSRGVP